MLKRLGAGLDFYDRPDAGDADASDASACAARQARSTRASRRQHGGRAVVAGMVIGGALLCSGCGVSSSSVSESGSVPAGPLRLDIFSARGFLGGSDYERYVVDGDVLWRECGQVTSAKKGRTVPPLEGDAVLSKDPQLTPGERRVEALTETEVAAIKRAVVRTFDAASTERDAGQDSGRSDTDPAAASPQKGGQISLADRLPPPGSIFSLVSPGVFELSASLGGQSGRFVTAVDAVAERETAALGEMNSLFATVRGIGPVICGSKTFFGVGREPNARTREKPGP